MLLSRKFKYIDKKKDLTKAISEIKQNKVIAVDTEFLRSSTYYAKTCLIQIASKNFIYLIDPIALKNIEELGVIFAQKKILKLFFSLKQDIEVLKHSFNFTLKNVLDVQIALNLLKYRYMMSYGDFVESFFAIKLDKELRRFDWQKRPIDQKHLIYAANDVYFLLIIYDFLEHTLDKKELKFIAYLESRRVQKEVDNKDFYSTEYLNFLSQKNLAKRNLIIKLTSFREEKAELLNIPKNHFLTKTSFNKIIKQNLNSLDLEIIKAEKSFAYQSDIKDLIRKTKKTLSIYDFDKFNEVAKKLEIFVKIKSKETNITSNILASRIMQKDYLDYIFFKRTNLPILLTSWRRKIFNRFKPKI